MEKNMKKEYIMYICICEYVYVYVSMSWQRKEWVGRGNPSVRPLATQPHRAVISVPHLCRPFQSLQLVGSNPDF